MQRLMMLGVLAGVLGAGVAEAQIPTQYRMTRTAPGQQPNTFIFQASAVRCDLVYAPAPSGIGVRWESHIETARDCEYLGPGNWTNLPAGVTHTFTLAGCLADGRCGPESDPFIDGLPGKPGRMRMAPGYTGVTASGIVQERGPAAGLDVAAVYLLDPPELTGAVVYVGAAGRLAVPGFAVERGDEATVQFRRLAP